MRCRTSPPRIRRPCAVRSERKVWRRAPYSKRLPRVCNPRSHLACASLGAAIGSRTRAMSLARTSATVTPWLHWSGHSGSNRAKRSLEGWPLTKRISAKAVPNRTAKTSRCFRDYRSPRSESNRTRLDTNEVHGHRAAWAGAPQRNSAAALLPWTCSVTLRESLLAGQARRLRHKPIRQLMSPPLAHEPPAGC